MARYDFNAQRLYVTGDLAAGETIEAGEGQAHYLINVLRMKPGVSVLLFNGRDGEWRAVIAEATKRRCILTATERTREQTVPGDLHYCFAPLKKARLDYMVQKATEMGASRLRPVMTRRTVAERLNIDRMRANAIEAAEQCGILSVPEIDPPVALERLVSEWDIGRRLILCDEDAPVADPLAALRALPRGPLALLVGPEGGFAEEERALLQKQPGAICISLGPRILRADTAAIAALTLVQAVLGDLAG